MNPRIIITADAHACLQEDLVQRGFDVDVRASITYNELYEIIADYHGMVVTTRIKVDQQLIDAAPQLKWIGRLGSGMEIIDVDYAVQKGIVCFSSPEGNKDEVAEHCLGTLLGLMHKIFSSSNEVRKGLWIREENRGIELGGKTVGIIGFGNTGSAFAALLVPFGVKVLAHDKYKKGFSVGNVFEASLDQLFSEADVVSFHLPLNAETHHFANDDFFNHLKKPVFFLNVSRGGIVNTKALIRAMDSGRVIAAGLDVLENESLKSYTDNEMEQHLAFTSRANVVITPHIAGYSRESFEKMAKVLIFKLDEFQMD